MTQKLADLAVRFGCEVRGNPDTEVDRVGTLQDASAGCLSFLANKGYKKYLAGTGASAVIVTADIAEECPVDCLIAQDPYLTYAHIAADLHPSAPLRAGVHVSAVVADDATVPASCEVAAGAVVAAGAQLGERVVIGSNSVVGEGVSIGDDTRLAANVSVYSQVSIGSRCVFHSGVVLGGDGFGIAQSPQGWVKVPQVGGVRIGNDVEIGSNSTVDCGAIEDTVIGDGVKLDNLVQIAHNVVIGDHTVMASQAGISGSTKIGARCVIGGRAATAGHLNICDDVYLLGGANVSRSISKPGMYSNVITAEDASKWRRIAARIKNLDEFARRLITLEKQVNDSDKQG